MKDLISLCPQGLGQKKPLLYLNLKPDWSSEVNRSSWTDNKKSSSDKPITELRKNPRFWWRIWVKNTQKCHQHLKIVALIELASKLNLLNDQFFLNNYMMSVNLLNSSLSYFVDSNELGECNFSKADNLSTTRSIWSSVTVIPIIFDQTVPTSMSKLRRRPYRSTLDWEIRTILFKCSLI